MDQSLDLPLDLDLALAAAVKGLELGRAHGLLDAGAKPWILMESGGCALSAAVIAFKGEPTPERHRLLDRMLAETPQSERAGLGMQAALGEACYFDEPALVDALIKAGADPDGFGAAGMTPLGWCAMRRSARAAKALMSAGASPDLPCGIKLLHCSPKSPLAHAIDSGGMDTVEALLDGGARWDIPDADGLDAMALARRSSTPGMAALFEARMAREQAGQLECSTPDAMARGSRPRI